MKKKIILYIKKKHFLYIKCVHLFNQFTYIIFRIFIHIYLDYYIYIYMYYIYMYIHMYMSYTVYMYNSLMANQFLLMSFSVICRVNNFYIIFVTIGVLRLHMFISLCILTWNKSLVSFKIYVIMKDFFYSFTKFQ